MRVKVLRSFVLAFVVCTLGGGLSFAADPAAVRVTAKVHGRRSRSAATGRGRCVGSRQAGELRSCSALPLFEHVGAPVGEALRGKELTKYVVVEASDGYRAVFSLAELSPAFSGRKIIVATNRDGKLLPASEGPFRIAVEAEKRMARCVRQVTAISIVDAIP